MCHIQFHNFKGRCCYPLYHTVRGSVLEQVLNKSLIKEGKGSISAIDDKAYKLSNMHPAVVTVLHRESCNPHSKAITTTKPQKETE